MSNLQSEIMSKEHDGESQPNVLEPLRVGSYGWDPDALQWIKIQVDSTGILQAK